MSLHIYPFWHAIFLVEVIRFELELKVRARKLINQPSYKYEYSCEVEEKNKVAHITVL